MFAFVLPVTPGYTLAITPYNIPLQDEDVVKVRTTHPDTQTNLHKGQRGKVIGQMHMVTVQFEDGTVETYNRDELNMKIPGLEEMMREHEKKPWE